MEDDIFEGAKFGDIFITRDGSIARYCGRPVKRHILYIENFGVIEYDTRFILQNSTSDKDIVSKGEEVIDKEHLKELATKSAKKWYEPVSEESNYDFWRECFECYQEGYIQSLSEKLKIQPKV